MATNYETVLVTKENGITTIAFNRPEKRNAMSPQLHNEMFDLLTELRYDKKTRVIVLTGAGEGGVPGEGAIDEGGFGEGRVEDGATGAAVATRGFVGGEGTVGEGGGGGSVVLDRAAIAGGVSREETIDDARRGGVVVGGGEAARELAYGTLASRRLGSARRAPEFQG